MTRLTLAEAEEAHRLAMEAVGIAAKAAEEAENDLNAAYRVLDRANAALRAAKRARVTG
jgi:hypothetical protein